LAAKSSVESTICAESGGYSVFSQETDSKNNKRDVDYQWNALTGVELKARAPVERIECHGVVSARRGRK
jgi:hypothetical protein